MPWVRFKADFTHTHPATPGRSVEYRAGMRLLVTTHCAEEAIAAGAADRAASPKAEKKAMAGGDGDNS
jgi:hypothetical protein